MQSKNQALFSAQEALYVMEELTLEPALGFMEKSAWVIAHCMKNGGKLLVAGNGGSLCDANHCAEEFVGYFRSPRKALPAISLSEPGMLTCIANDSGFEKVFARSIEALGKRGDVFMGLTTSGNSPNLIEGFETAKKMGLATIAFLGKGGGKLKGIADVELLIARGKTSDRIQEAHMAAIHIIIELVEKHLFQHKEEEVACAHSR